ncbi:glycosyltransferase family 2 protein [Marinobacter sp. JSM 1782161]|uniref:glycosyltransferase family 2 protein n=1 Tax=Marinobacter sp. JSM 1782161 TaxID=2685906 RepID=UPI001402F600|nr:glycosyltransferase family 2 protein [Marinobacter sp. JSM 1782161]
MARSTEQPLVTVIIPAFNAEQYLDDTLQSIEAQTYANIEIIVVDDGSTDSTAELVQAHAPRVRYIHQPNSGSCAAPRNNGLKHAQGEFITFFDADDIMLPEKIAQQVRQFQDHPDAVAVISNYRNFTDTETSVDHFATCPTITARLADSGQQAITLPSTECRRILIDENFTIASSPLFRRSVVDAEQGFDVSLRACEDFHLIYRVALKGPLVVVPDVGFERRLHDLNMSGDPERMMFNFIRSRASLVHLETTRELQDTLADLVRHMKREFQTLLIRKGKLREAFGLFSQTLPPTSRRELKHDVFQGTKLCLTALGLRKVEWPS